MLITRTSEDLKKPLTPEQIAELEALKNIEPEPDDENPELTEEQLKKLVRVSELRRKTS